MSSTFTPDIDLPDARCARLRAWRRDDLADLVANADPTARFPYPYCGGDGHGWLDGAMRDPNGRWALELDGRAIGGVSLHVAESGVGELGYWLGYAHWRCGIMTRVLTRFAPQAMHAFDLHRLFAAVYVDNPASMRVLEKAGFTREGARKSSVVTRDGPLELIVYARTADGLALRNRPPVDCA